MRERIRTRFRFGLLEVALEAQGYWSAPVVRAELEEVGNYPAWSALVHTVLVIEAVIASAVFTFLWSHGQL